MYLSNGVAFFRSCSIVNSTLASSGSGSPAGIKPRRPCASRSFWEKDVPLFRRGNLETVYPAGLQKMFSGVLGLLGRFSIVDRNGVDARALSKHDAKPVKMGMEQINVGRLGDRKVT